MADSWSIAVGLPSIRRSIHNPSDFQPAPGRSRRRARRNGRQVRVWVVRLLVVGLMQRGTLKIFGRRSGLISSTVRMRQSSSSVSEKHGCNLATRRTHSPRSTRQSGPRPGGRGIPRPRPGICDTKSRCRGQKGIRQRDQSICEVAVNDDRLTRGMNPKVELSCVKGSAHDWSSGAAGSSDRSGRRPFQTSNENKN